VLRAATSVAAEAIGLGDEVGTLAVGRVADLLVVKGNPLRDLAALSEPRLVVARGQRVVPPAPEAQGETESERRRR
jgi:imidazolonepropionase-like amidohydrolase